MRLSKEVSDSTADTVTITFFRHHASLMRALVKSRKVNKIHCSAINIIILMGSWRSGK